MEAQAVATRLMLDLTGARLVPGTIDVGGDGPPPKTIAPARRTRHRSARGRDPARAQRRDPGRARVQDRRRAHDGLDVTVPPFRRDDVTREADLIEEVARIDGLDKLPVDAALAPRGARPTDAAPEDAPARRRRAHRPGAGRDRGVEPRRPRAGRPAAAGPRSPASPHARAREPAVRRPVGATHHAARLAARHRAPQPGPRRRDDPAVRGRRGLPARRRRAVAARALSRRRGADRTGAAAHLARRPPAGRRLLRGQGRARRAARRAARAMDRRARRRAVPAPGPGGEHPRRRRSRRLDRRDPSARGRRMGSRRDRGGVRARTSTRWRFGRRRCTGR